MKNKKQAEKYSSAITLSDMELFIFPELMYALVLANIMSPKIWEWKKDPFLQNMDGYSFNKKIQRLKQFIMDKYIFNLDLDTWGLTTKEKEIERFSSFLDMEWIYKSNALFGYEGDKYYFDIDIRKHFGLDKYTGDIIPYWKTETVEAMDAFKYKEGHKVGAGECVSLSSLYVAALYIILDIPLEDIFIIATPLHSQNFIIHKDGIITNNRRIVTKSMWFNGTELSQKARRALEKEKISFVSHVSGYSHISYEEASIEKEEFERFSETLHYFMNQKLTFETFVNFLRVHNQYQKLFQFEYFLEGKNYYIEAEKLFRYEHSSKVRISDKAYKKFLQQIDPEEFQLNPFEERNMLQVIKSFLNGKDICLCNPAKAKEFEETLINGKKTKTMIKELCSFLCQKPKLPDRKKEFIQTPKITIPLRKNREEIIDYLSFLREKSIVCDLAFLAYRQIDTKSLPFFLKACFERNPVSIKFFKEKEYTEVYNALQNFENTSIYDSNRLATPDEVVNFTHGDGIEKALTLANVIKNREQVSLKLEIQGKDVKLFFKDQEFVFETNKKVDWGKSLEL